MAEKSPDAVEVQPVRTPASDSRPPQLVSWCGRIAGPLLALFVYSYLGSLDALTPEATKTGAIATLMAIWWMTEAIPLPVTSMLPLVLFPLCGILDLSAAAPSYANKYIFLFMGGFMIARAVEKWNLHRRIALLTVSLVGTQPSRLVAGFMLATAGLSMWISNTASTVMMLPIGLSLVTLLSEHLHQADQESHGIRKSVGGAGENFATCMMLGIAYAASIGGLATLVGTPTNLFLAGFADEKHITIGFGRWMLFATPLALMLLAATWMLLTKAVFPIRVKQLDGSRALIQTELDKMGRVSRGEWIVLVVFGLTAFAWVVREPVTNAQWLVELLPAIAKVDDTVIALVGMISLFLIPVDLHKGRAALDWETAVNIPWGVLLLFGGGFCLAEAVADSGLAEWIGTRVEVLDLSKIALMIAVVTLVVFLTELTSNTPTAATFLPILYGVAQGMNVDPMLLLVPATLAATCAFMLPVATPPNAIVFGSGHIAIGSMVKAGLWLNLLSIALISLWMWLVGTRVFGMTQ
ncbi:MAG: DASS family sodium-coupled anion symporter [Planctomycetaceae bacterium]|nr:DASS family sodium-coupled anion symporter [Planctomycetales bacterium]MCB9872703.1 DASS family sodium-coupled anion symporter [Planctomycetaceae bacterium]MCB9926190.1 DASS family sodium-coupled anion symporter [Planctomycetaceae bacterium]